MGYTNHEKLFSKWSVAMCFSALHLHKNTFFISTTSCFYFFSELLQCDHALEHSL